MKITCIITSPSGEAVFTASIDGCVKVWELRRGEASLTLVRSLLFADPVYSLACCEKGLALAVTCGDSVRVVDIAQVAALDKTTTTSYVRGHKLAATVGPSFASDTTTPSVPSTHLAGIFPHAEAKDPVYHRKAVRVAISADGGRVDVLFKVSPKALKLYLVTFSVHEGRVERTILLQRLKEDCHMQRVGEDLYVACAEGYVFRVPNPSSGMGATPKDADVLVQVASTIPRIRALSIHPAASAQDGGIAVVSLATGRTELLRLGGAHPNASHESHTFSSVACSATSRSGEYTAIGGADSAISLVAHNMTPVKLCAEEDHALIFSLPESDLSLGDVAASQELPSQDFHELTQYKDFGDTQGPPMTSQELHRNRASQNAEGMLMRDETFAFPGASQSEVSGSAVAPSSAAAAAAEEGDAHMRRFDSDIASVAQKEGDDAMIRMDSDLAVEAAQGGLFTGKRKREDDGSDVAPEAKK